MFGRKSFPTPDRPLSLWEWLGVAVLSLPGLATAVIGAVVVLPVLSFGYVIGIVYNHFQRRSEDLRELEQVRASAAMDKYEKALAKLLEIPPGKRRQRAVEKIQAARRVGVSIRGSCLFQELTPSGLPDDEGYEKYSKFGCVLNTIRALYIERSNAVGRPLEVQRKEDELGFTSAEQVAEWDRQDRLANEWAAHHDTYNKELLLAATDRLGFLDPVAFDSHLETLAEIQRIADRTLRGMS